MDYKKYVLEKAKLAKKASETMATLDTNIKNKVLKEMAKALIKNTDYIIEENVKDMENARKNGLSEGFLGRLLLTEDRIEDMANGLINIASLPDPLGETVKMWRTPDNLQVGNVRIPLGVIGIIYESSPNVTVDAAGLCIKSGNSVILKGGSAAINSNIALSNIVTEAATKNGLPKGCIQIIENTNRKSVTEMMKLDEYIDVLIPRGGSGLINAVNNNASIPVIKTGVGNCHIFVDKSAQSNIAQDIVINAKTQRPTACNSVETLLVHKDIAKDFLPNLANRLQSLNVELRGCSKTQKIIKEINPASTKDWEREYLDLILSIKIVDSIDEAINHILKYSTKHSEAIITNSYKNTQKFLQKIDSVAVYVNATTRFTDGGMFGFGAEIGISTQKLHARGPMGLNELTTTKYIIMGNGQIRK